MLCYWHFSGRSFLLALSRSKWSISCNWRCSPGQKRIPFEGSQQNIILFALCRGMSCCWQLRSWHAIEAFGWLGVAPPAMQASGLPAALEMDSYLPYWGAEYLTSSEQNVLIQIWLTNSGGNPCPCQAILILPSDFRFSYRHGVHFTLKTAWKFPHLQPTYQPQGCSGKLWPGCWNEK